MIPSSSKTAIIGAGSWGTALAITLARKGYSVQLWGHSSAHIDNLIREGENRKYLPGFPLGASVFPTSSLQEAVAGCQVVCMVVPSHGFRDVYDRLLPLLEDGTIVVSAVKGIENETLMTMTQVMEDVEQRADCATPICHAVLSGPSFAKEVAQELPTAVTIGCRDKDITRFLQNHFVTPNFRVYGANDVTGLELSGALKNIIAIAAGICDGLGYGLNTRAALITRGLAEMTRLGLAMGAQEKTFYGLSGIGDLMLTCTGDLSRNRSVGLLLGQEKNLKEIIDSMNMVAEGVKTTR